LNLDDFNWEDAVRRCRSYTTHINRRKVGLVLALLLLWWFATNRESGHIRKAHGSSLSNS
jgi:hypothetical protein